MTEHLTIPAAAEFTDSPLRNRIAFELTAAVSDVWELMGDLARFPEYSIGLGRVDVVTDGEGRCAEYTCYFKALDGEPEGAVSRDLMKWYEPNRGYVSVEVEGGNTVALMTLDPIADGTRVNYDMHFDADELEATKAAIDEALVDIAENLIARFGGKIIDRYVED